MTEDEAFIRAIVDNPGDDTPRLVDADWLDDRDDPRGTYLRAENEWAATHDPDERTALLKMAKELDAVWVARISRPPVGVCCDHVRFAESGPPLMSADLDVAAEILGREIPTEFRAFLLNYNGGVPTPARFMGPASEPGHPYGG